MKKTLGIWLAVVVFVITAVACSLLPDAKRILGDYWASSSYTRVTITTNGGVYMSMIDETNYSSKAASEQWMTILEATVHITELTNGLAVTNYDYAYVLNEDAGTISVTMDFNQDGTNDTMTFNYTFDNTIFTMTFLTNVDMGSGAAQVMCMTNIFTKE